MKRLTLLTFLLLAIACAQVPDSLIAAMKIRYKMPEGYREIEAKQEGDVGSQWAIASEKAKVEIRFSIHSLRAFKQEYEKSKQDSNQTMLNPNNLFPSLTMASALNLSGGDLSTDGLPQFSSFPPDAVKKEFGADAGGVVVVPLKKSYAHKYCMIMTLHKQNTCDIYVYMMYDDQNMFSQTELQKIMYCIGYQP